MDEAAPVTVGIVGAGGIARTHAQALVGLGVPTVVTSTGPSAQRLADELGLTAVGDLPTLLDAVEVVLIATPTPTHRSIALAAFDAGRDVIAEKPLARTAADAREIVEEAVASGRRVDPAHVVRWFPAHEAVRDAVVGREIVEIDLLRRGGRPTAAWFHDRVASGGVLLDLAIHDLDYATWLAGPVVQVSTEIDDGDHAVVRLEHASGTRTRVEAQWQTGATGLTTAIGVRCADGEITWRSDGVAEGVVVEETATDPYARMLADLLAARRTGVPVRVTAADGVHAVEIAEAAARSATTGSPVPILS